MKPGAYDVQVVDAFGQAIGATQTVVLKEGAIRVDLRVEQPAAGTPQDRSRWKVVAIVGGAAAALALAGGGGDSASPSR
jgi:hypothetical protein